MNNLKKDKLITKYIEFLKYLSMLTPNFLEYALLRWDLYL